MFLIHNKLHWNHDPTNLYNYDKVLGITNDIPQPGQSYSKMYGAEPRYNESRCNEILVITNNPEAQT